MATNKVTPIRAVEPPFEPDEFTPLMRRFLLAIAQLQVVTQCLDVQDLPAEFEHAGLVLHETTKSIDEIYDEIDSWAVRHTHKLREDMRS
jgi:hypothetical protein